MYHSTWHPEDVPALIERAREAGTLAAKVRLRELETHGPRWSLPSNELDICGYGAIHLTDGRTSPARALREVFEAGAADRWTISPDYIRNGFILAIWHMGGRQELAINRVATEAAAQVLRDAGLECTVVTWVD